jgi:GNAT superfamily N-acetyltransferase
MCRSVRHDVSVEHLESGSVEIVRDRQDPEAIERLLRALPDWFGIEESLRDYVEDARGKPTYLAIGGSDHAVLGALVATTHNPLSAEMHLLAVNPEHHRRGVGRALVMAFEADMAASGLRLVQVKTQGPSRPDEGYEKTLAFYLAMGYIPLEELHGIWAENPCLILVKPL